MAFAMSALKGFFSAVGSLLLRRRQVFPNDGPVPLKWDNVPLSFGANWFSRRRTLYVWCVGNPEELLAKLMVYAADPLVVLASHLHSATSACCRRVYGRGVLCMLGSDGSFRAYVRDVDPIKGRTIEQVRNDILVEGLQRPKMPLHSS